MIDYYEPNIDLTLLGCGFLGNYYIGAICLLKQIWPHKPYNRICGASCGGLLGALLTVGTRLEVVIALAYGTLMELRGFIKNPWELISVKDLITQVLEKTLPENAHKLCTGRLGVSLTKLWSFENVLVKEFKSRQDLIDAIIAGCFIPIWSGSLSSPIFRGQKCVDGAYSNNAPKFELTPEDRRSGVRQIDICPFAGPEFSVSPPDKWGVAIMRIMGSRYYLNWGNIIRCNQAMMPVSWRTYTPYLLAGHRDMKEYVLKNNLIKCRECHQQDNQKQQQRSMLTIQEDKILLESLDRKSSSSCLLCLKLLEKIDSLTFPNEFLSAWSIDDMC